MWCVAVCHDAENAIAARASLFQAHAAHNIPRLGSFLFTAPLATADGVTAVDSDPRVNGSLYCLDMADLRSARALMEADPYMGTAWRQIDYYEWPSPSGDFLDEEARPKGLSADFRCYFAASDAELSIDGALMLGEVALIGSTAGAVLKPLSAIGLLRAEDMAAAKRVARGATQVAAAPVAIGRWVRICTAADLPQRG